MAEEGETYENFVFPAPPPYYKNFTARNIERLKELKEAGTDGNSPSGASILLNLPPELRYLVPPEPPENGVVRNFGEVKTNRDSLMTLLEMDIRQVYPESAPQTADATQWTLDRAFYLKKIARSIIFSFIELVGTLSENPTQHPDKIVHIKTLLFNAHHLINEYRPHQARESLIMMMEKQIQTKRDEIEKIKALKDKVDTLLGGLGKEDANGISLFPQDEPAPPSPEELWKKEQRAVWAALDEELGQ